jgi:hypothetical protein
MVYFNARRRGFLSESSLSVSDDVTQLVLQCTETVGDQVTSQTHLIELRASHDPTLEFPAPSPLPKPVGTIRPALCGDQLNLSNQDLIRAGYPIRPDPKEAPGAYRAWLEVVSRPTTVVVPQTVARPDVNFGAVTHTNNWSGIQLREAFQASPSGSTAPSFTSDPYDLVMGEWRVPYVDLGVVEPGHDAAAMWIGLDDDSGVNGPSITCPGC